MFDRLFERFPEANQEQLVALAEVWTKELNSVVRRMLEICASERGPIPRAARHEATFELAQLILWLEDRIVHRKTSSISIDDLDPSAEDAGLVTDQIQQCIENTAKACAASIWGPLLDDWHRRFPLVSGTSTTLSRPGSAAGLRQSVLDRVSGAKHQHFSPVFSNKYWASGKDARVRVYSQGFNTLED